MPKYQTWPLKDGIPQCDSMGVYDILCVIDGKLYFGSATDKIRGRLRDHQRKLRQNKHCNPHLQNAWNKHGEEHFQFRVRQLVAEEENCTVRESWYIERYKTYDREHGYNICREGTNRLGVEHREGSKAKMSATKKAKYAVEPGPRTGAVLSEETKEKISKTKTGSKRSKESRAKQSATNTGRPTSEAHKAAMKTAHWSKGPNAKAIGDKIAAGLKGKTLSEDTKQKISDTKQAQMMARGPKAPKVYLTPEEISAIRSKASKKNYENPEYRERQRDSCWMNQPGAGAIHARANAKKRGRPFTEEHKAAMAKATRRRWARWRQERARTTAALEPGSVPSLFD